MWAGSASDIIKFAMLSVEKLLESHFSRYINSASNSDDGRDTMNNTFAQKYNFRPRIVSQIHDEVIYDVPLFESEKTGSLRVVLFLHTLYSRFAIHFPMCHCCLILTRRFVRLWR